MLSIQKNISNAKKRFVNASIFIQEGDFIVKTLTNDDEKTQAYRLRHRVFCEELGWVPINSASLEIDKYDQHAIFIGVFDDRHKLTAFSRLISPGTTFMIEKEFSSLIG
jgi:acyl homoserine lactone synthase